MKKYKIRCDDKNSDMREILDIEIEADGWWCLSASCVYFYKIIEKGKNIFGWTKKEFNIFFIIRDFKYIKEVTEE